MLLFLTTNMAAVTSRANQQFGLASLFRSLSLALFVSFPFLVYKEFCCSLYRLSFAWNCGWLTD